MSKLDDLIAQLESPQPFERALVLEELRRLQARERRLEELLGRWKAEDPEVDPFDSPYKRGCASVLLTCIGELESAILEET